MCNPCNYLQSIVDSAFWGQFHIIAAEAPTSRSIFGLAEYLASLALFLVVINISDFRYSYRLSLTRINLRKFGFMITLIVGLSILVTDIWFENGLPIPKLFSSENNVKAALGFVFLSFVFIVISVAVAQPPKFSKRNAKQFLDVNYHFIHQGDPGRLQIVAEELRRSLPSIFTIAAGNLPHRKKKVDENVAQDCARQLLLLLADRRFCRVVVDKVPSFAFTCFLLAQESSYRNVPIFQFARNIGQEFIKNTGSSFYQEESGYYSGLVGYAKPATKIVFGSYEFIERCASQGASPIDTDYREFNAFNPVQLEGYTRAALAFLESNLQITKGRSRTHSYALARMLDALGGPL
jgi:hypothetical protein